MFFKKKYRQNNEKLKFIGIYFNKEKNKNTVLYFCFLKITLLYQK